MIACPCCGGRGEISETVPAMLSPMEARIFDVVRRCPEGIDARSLLERVYADDPDGGPEGAALVMRVTIWRMNGKLKSRGYKVAAGRGHTLYKLQRLA